MSSTEGARVLNQGVGYGVVLGIGFVFAVFMMGLSYLQNRYTNFKTTTSEEFNTASRSVKPGLIASGIVSGGRGLRRFSRARLSRTSGGSVGATTMRRARRCRSSSWRFWRSA